MMQRILFSLSLSLAVALLLGCTAGTAPEATVPAPAATPAPLPAITPNPDFDLETALQERLAACPDDERQTLAAALQPLQQQILALHDEWRAGAGSVHIAGRLRDLLSQIEALPAGECWTPVRDDIARAYRDAAAILAQSQSGETSFDQARILVQPLYSAAVTLLDLLESDPALALFRADRAAAAALPADAETPPALQYQLDLLALDDFSACNMEATYQSRFAEAAARATAAAGITNATGAPFPCDLYPAVSARTPVTVVYTVEGAPNMVAERIIVAAPGGRTREYRNQPLPFHLEATLLTGDKAQVTAFVPTAPGSLIPVACSATANGVQLSETLESAPELVSCGGYLREAD